MPKRRKTLGDNTSGDIEMQSIIRNSLIGLPFDVILQIADHLEISALFTLFYAAQSITRMRAVLTSALFKREDFVQKYFALTYFQPIQLLPDHFAFSTLQQFKEVLYYHGETYRQDMLLAVKCIQVFALLTTGARNRNIASRLTKKKKNALTCMMSMNYEPCHEIARHRIDETMRQTEQATNTKKRADCFSRLVAEIKEGLSTKLKERIEYSYLLLKFSKRLPSNEIPAIFSKNYKALIQLFRDKEKTIGYRNMPAVFFILFDQLDSGQNKTMLARQCEREISEISRYSFPTEDRRDEYIQALHAAQGDRHHQDFRSQYWYDFYLPYEKREKFEPILTRIFDRLHKPNERLRALYNEMQQRPENTTPSPS